MNIYPGSTPLARGTLFPSQPAAKIIAVQPRLRGELASRVSCTTSVFGSTPLARGTLPRCTECCNTCRFNPACAGNSPDRNSKERIILRFNPACAGNSQIVIVDDIDVRGSTPLARGTRTPIPRASISVRFNPACAGNSAVTETDRPLGPVQPRLRGELATTASSPFFIKRFNPACAGNSVLLL